MAKKVGRKRRGPWLRAQDNAWYTTINRKAVKIGSADLPYDDVERAYHALLAEHDQGEKPTCWTVAALVDAFLDYCFKRKSAGTYKWYFDYLTEFYKVIGDAMKATDLKPNVVTRWVETRYQGCSDSTKFAAIRSVVRVFNWAVAEGYLVRSPIKGIEKPTPVSRESVISPTQFGALIVRIRDLAFRDALMFLWNTGARPQELRIIEARHVDLANRKIVLDRVQSKGKKNKRTIYLNDVALEIVRRRVAEWPEGAIFRNTRKKAWTKNSLNCRFKRLRKEKIEVEGKKVFRPIAELKGLCSYTLRHSYITEALKRGEDSLKVALACGTSQRMIEKVYQHLLKDDDAMLKVVQGGGTVPVVVVTSIPLPLGIPIAVPGLS